MAAIDLLNLTNQKYDNTFSGLTALSGQAAIDELSTTLDTIDLSLYLEKAGGTMTGLLTAGAALAVTGNITLTGTVDGRDVAADGTKLDTIDTSANNYTHPSDGVDPGAALTGATVFSDITVNAAGHVTGSATRDITLANLGYTGSATANDYTHPSDGVDPGAALAGATVFSDITVNAAGHVTGSATRDITLANLGYTGSATANDYSHPTHPGDDINVDTTALTGATVISDLDFNITTDTLGHVTDANAIVATRDITLANLGYTGSATANDYTHPSDGVDPGAALTGAAVFSDITVNAAGHVTGSATRDITLANLGYTGSATANDYTHPATHPWSILTSTPTTLAGYGITDAATFAQGALADTALQSFDITTQTDSKYLRSNAADTASGLITFSAGIATNTIVERTAAAGVTIDGVLLKDSKMDWSYLSNVPTYNNYTHPSDGVDPGAALAGATVFSDITVNAAGHVTGSATRDITLANLGYTGSATANDYTHPAGHPWSILTSGVPTTLSGYGITDAYTKTEADGKYLLNTTDTFTGTLTVTGNQSISGDITGTGTGTIATGVGNGSVGMTINDGQGNANITFNHIDGSTDIAGNAARIVVNTDSTTGAKMSFETLSNATLGAVSTIERLGITDTLITATVPIAATSFTEGGTLLNAKYLGITAKAADSQLLDNINSTSFLRSDATDIKTAGHLTFNDSIKLQLGTGGDTRFWNNGLSTYLDMDSTANVALYIRDGTTIRYTFARTGLLTAAVAISSPTITASTLLRAVELRTNNGTQLVLNAGEANSYATGQTGEQVYINAEGGLQINSSPDNWATLWAGRTTATINAAGGASTFPGSVTATNFVGNLNGYATSTSSTANTYALRQGNGYLFATYFNGTGTFALAGAASGIANFTGTNGTDTYGRSYSLAGVRTAIHAVDITMASAKDVILSGTSQVRWSDNGGGINMQDTTWVRVYGSKQFYNPNTGTNSIATPGDVVAGYSDMRLKTKVGTIENALEKVCSLEGFIYERNELAQSLGYKGGERRSGLSAQDVVKVLPEVVSSAPCNIDKDTDYMTVDYDRVVPLLVEAIKELKQELEELKNDITK